MIIVNNRDENWFELLNCLKEFNFDIGGLKKMKKENEKDA